ncbi:hypothetical protein CALCODRAFT_512302 [Calocera cornea HHB12733]|uniref:Uncharacterized protein n=1 Tax=Calocera cornea HHB12733 TaxID=1353952 RepID=A0A165D4I6_9BASI|nr:hypothetical protein CALCODRAFT_512302 [Calocera cornea HHB12733]
MDSLTPYNISLNSSSPTFIYEPFRDGSAALDHGDPAGDRRKGWRGTFSEVQVWPNPGIENVGLGVPLRETYLDGANVTLNFEVDDNPITTTASGSDPACANSGAHVTVYASGLEYNNHSATLRVNAEEETEFLFYGGVVTVGMSGFDSPNSVVQYIDDTDPGWTYEPGGAWKYSAPAGNDAVGDYNETRHYVCGYGANNNARYTFNGASAVQLLGMLNWNLGPYTIQLDEMIWVYNASDLWRESQQVLFFQAGLDPTKDYTIVLMNYDSNAPNASQPYSGVPCTTIDALVLIKAEPPSTPSGSSTPAGTTAPSGSPTQAKTFPPSDAPTVTSVGAIAGGVCGAAVALGIIALLLWFVVRRRRQLRLRRAASYHINLVPNTSSSRGYRDTATTPDDAIASSVPVSLGYAGGRSPTDRTTRDAKYFPSTPSTPGTPFHQSQTRRETVSAEERPTVLDGASQRTPSSEPPSATHPSSDVQTDNDYFDRATTQTLVSVLNRRLHAEYREENEEPELPDYTSHL